MSEALLDALRNSRLSDAVIAFETYESDDICANIDELVEQTTLLAVGVRDKGRPEEALAWMLRLWDKSQNRRLCLEILVVITVLRWSQSQFKTMMDTIPPHLLLDKHIRLFVAKGYEAMGQPALAISLVKDVSALDVAEIPSFRQVRHQLIFDLIQYISNASVDLCVAAGCQNSSFEVAIEDTISAELKNCHSIDETWALVRHAVFANRPNLRITEKTMTNALTNVTSEHSNLKIVGLSLALACGRVELAVKLARQLGGTGAEMSPSYVKALFRLSDLSRNSEWSEQAAALSEKIVNNHGGESKVTLPSRAETQVSELFGRLSARHNSDKVTLAQSFGLPRSTKPVKLSSDRRHIFIGLFGQMRFPHKVLPELKAYIDSEISTFPSSDFEFSYGLSTWSKAGERHLELRDPANFLLDRMPLEVSKELLSIGVSTVADIKAHLPRTVDHIISEQRGAVSYNEDDIHSILGDKQLYTSISDGDLYLTSAGSLLSKRFPENVDLINQGRMWNRISALSQLIEQAENDKKIAVSHTILIRADLSFTSGSLGGLLARGLNNGSNWVFVDDDPHANFIEGLGDRYLVSDRIASNRILEGENLMRNVMEADEHLFSIYTKRLGAHQWLDTILFEHDTSVNRVSRQDVGFYIYRGRRSIDDVRSHLAVDIESSSVLAIRKLIYFL